MFMVGGGILIHGIPGAHDLSHRLAHGVGALPGVGRLLETGLLTLLDVLVGLLAGALVLVGETVAARFYRMIKGAR